MLPRSGASVLTVFAVVSALSMPAAAWPSICWHEQTNDYSAAPAVEVGGPSCQENGNRLILARRGGDRIETLISDSWGLFSDSHGSCVTAEHGLEFYLDASPSLIRKLNDTGDVSLPPGLVIRQTLGGRIGFDGAGPRAYAYAGSCASFQGKLQEYFDCRKRCKDLAADAAAQQCGTDERRTTCEKINGMESQDYLGYKEVDLAKFAKDLVTLGQAADKNRKKTDP